MAVSKNMLYILPDSYIVVDLETTGLDARWDSIIELAAAKVENGHIVETVSTLVNPERVIDAFITELTGISTEMVQDAPKLPEVLPQFLDFIQRDVLMGHFLNFDVRFLQQAAANERLAFDRCQYVDTMHIARRVYPEWEHHRLCDLVEHLGVTTEGAHRALADVKATKACYDVLRQVMAERGMTEADMRRTYTQSMAKNITVQDDAYREDEDIVGKEFVFTGAMERMVRKDAMQQVVNAGGSCGDNVTKSTNYLVLGNAGYCIDLAEGKSGKRRKAEALKLKGADIEIISEDVFLQMLEP